MEAGKETTEEEEEEELHHHLSLENLPIMHWEQLSERIAELERQEEERRERVKRETGYTQGRHWRDVWEEEEEDFRRRRLSVSSSRSQNHRNLQLCFINDSHSEEEEEEEEGDTKACQGPKGARHNGCHGTGLKQEVVSALRALRDQLLAEQKEEEEVCSSSCVSQRKHLDLQDLQLFTLQQLLAVRASLQQEVHALSSELVTHLLVRDQLRTKQDAMLLDVQDLT